MSMNININREKFMLTSTATMKLTSTSICAVINIVLFYLFEMTLPVAENDLCRRHAVQRDRLYNKQARTSMLR
jgi:hypothetical protein